MEKIVDMTKVVTLSLMAVKKLLLLKNEWEIIKLTFLIKSHHPDILGLLKFAPKLRNQINPLNFLRSRLNQK